MPRAPKANKINTLHKFTVEGNFEFPWDMLRYDQCWPTHESNITQLAPYRPGPDKRQVFLTGLREPTEGRWQSFGWKVVEYTTLSVG